jgi:hypothetical protein
MLEERVNPGYDRSIHCLLLTHLEAEYEKLLTQADNFRLEQGAAMRIWGGRMQNFMPESVCARYEPGGSDSTGCALCLEGVCLDRLPECPGICRKYRPADKKERESNGP